MKKKKLFRMFILALALVLTVAASGCGSDTGNNPVDNPPDDPVINDPVDNNPVDNNPVEDKAIRVSSTEELLAAIAPDAEIIIEPGYYNMSEFVETFDYDAIEEWNGQNRYVQIEECFDGNDIIIQNVSGLSITGGGEAYGDTELVVEPRYAAILTFDNCADISLTNITMGHTMESDCAGNVLNFYDCEGAALTSMDLYGCGVYGISVRKNWGDIIVTDSIIRDCAYGSVDICESEGKCEFRNCVFTGSYGGGYFEKTENSELCFYNCQFGESESNTWYFNEDIIAEDCIWSEITSYPDYSE